MQSDIFPTIIISATHILSLQGNSGIYILHFENLVHQLLFTMFIINILY